MRNFFHKYSLKFILGVLSFTIFLSCIQKHKFDSDKKRVDEKKMTSVLTDIFLMEAYVNEKMLNIYTDSLLILRQSYYKVILKHHKVDSAAFYSTFNYYHAHPQEFTQLLNLVDSNISKIKPLDTTTLKPMVATPKNLDLLSNFNEQEAAMRKEYLKKRQSSQKFKSKNNENNK